MIELIYAKAMLLSGVYIFPLAQKNVMTVDLNNEPTYIESLLTICSRQMDFVWLLN